MECADQPDLFAWARCRDADHDMDRDMDRDIPYMLKGSFLKENTMKDLKDLILKFLSEAESDVSLTEIQEKLRRQLEAQLQT